MSCVNWNLRLCLSSGVEVQCRPMQAKVHYGDECQRYKQRSPVKKNKKSLTSFIFLQILTKCGKDLMKMLLMSPSLQSVTLRPK